MIKKIINLFFFLSVIFCSSISAVQLGQDRGDRFYAMWDDLRVAAQNTKINPLTSKPDFATFIDGTLTFLFDPSSDESVHFSLQLPHKYKQGTDLYPHVHWSPTSTSTGTVKWKLEYTISKLNDTFPTTTTIAASDPGDGTPYKHQFVYFPSINGSSITSVSTVLIFDYIEMLMMVMIILMMRLS